MSVPPAVASFKPFYVELKRGRRIAWCQCGRSKRQPYCDGRSHVGTGFEPFIYLPTGGVEEALLCGCKQTGTPPFCDGTHNNLEGGYRSDDRSAAQREAIPFVEADVEGIRRLDGRCYVVDPTATKPKNAGPFWFRTIIGARMGAVHQSLVYMEAKEKVSPVLFAGGSDVVLWVSAGEGTIEIAGHLFPACSGTGIYVRPDETFRLAPECEDGMRVFVSICPGTNGLVQIEQMSSSFDPSAPARICSTSEAQRADMGPRFFQMLIDKSYGLTSAAQFIGHIPRSRAEMHRHLYEEALIIESGEGVVWNEMTRAAIRAGDVLFLPRKQAHALECTDIGGMDVVGVIHPGDNPAINY